MRKVPLQLSRNEIEPIMWENSNVSRSYVCVRFSGHLSEIEEFTSLSRARAYIYFSISPPGRMSRRLVLFRGLVRLVESVEFRGLTSHRLSSSFRPYIPSIRLQRGFNVHAKQTAAPARLSIIRYIRLCLSNSSLTTPQT